MALLLTRQVGEGRARSLSAGPQRPDPLQLQLQLARSNAEILVLRRETLALRERCERLERAAASGATAATQACAVEVAGVGSSAETQARPAAANATQEPDATPETVGIDGVGQRKGTRCKSAEPVAELFRRSPGLRRRLPTQEGTLLSAPERPAPLPNASPPSPPTPHSPEEEAAREEQEELALAAALLHGAKEPRDWEAAAQAFAGVMERARPTSKPHNSAMYGLKQALKARRRAGRQPEAHT